VSVICGVIAYVLLYLPPEKQNLIEVRRILRSDKKLSEIAPTMADDERCAGMMQDAESAMHAKEGGYFVSGAKRHTEWLDSDAMKWALSSSSFELSELKTGKASVYLVLPANYLGQHGRFLRLFVRCAIDEMARKVRGQLRGSQCLFFLDEFYALGYIDEIAKAAGLMRGYGLQMWVIMQDLGQLIKLYGREGADTFFGNADLHQFFGNMDATTLNYISREIGKLTSKEIMQGFEPVQIGDDKWWEDDEVKKERTRAMITEMQVRRDVVNRDTGRERMPPDQVADFVSKKGRPVTDRTISFIQGRKILAPKPMAYFLMDQITWGKKKPKKKASIKRIANNGDNNAAYRFGQNVGWFFYKIIGGKT
jgi:type IV secretory pathway TraG/TraD family ATPase VirD4